MAMLQMKVFFLLLTCFFSNVCALMLKLPGRGEECLMLNSSRENMTLSFSAYPETTKQFVAIIQNSLSPETIYYHTDKTTGSYKFKTTDQTNTTRYKICFGNLGTGPLSVEFINRYTGTHLSTLATEESTRNLIEAVSNIYMNILDTSDELHYMLVSENDHRKTAELINERVLWCTAFKVVVILLLVLIQNCYLRRCFEIKLTV
ncbi:uncharacterized protein LOC128884108 [Hylaeus volcanicus]|uniref:uncharacterized protein LOC128884108 n=1 Tax=Hylaeus volcanicus TaxID=313075 RepID=UPI0023B781CA|nr:uncharacterized protein LOC128884108 [Hylaeus volcanicus]